MNNYHYIAMNPDKDGVPDFYLVNDQNIQFELSSIEDDINDIYDLVNGHKNQFEMIDHNGHKVTYSRQRDVINRISKGSSVLIDIKKLNDILNEIINDMN